MKMCLYVAICLIYFKNNLKSNYVSGVWGIMLENSKVSVAGKYYEDRQILV